MSESGDNKVIGNFRKLIDELPTEPAYDPSNAKLKLPALESQYNAGAATVDARGAYVAQLNIKNRF